MSELTQRARELLDKSYAGDYDAWDALKSEAPALVDRLTCALERVEKLADELAGLAERGGGQYAAHRIRQALENK